MSGPPKPYDHGRWGVPLNSGSLLDPRSRSNTNNNTTNNSSSTTTNNNSSSTTNNNNSSTNSSAPGNNTTRKLYEETKPKMKLRPRGFAEQPAPPSTIRFHNMMNNIINNNNITNNNVNRTSVPLENGLQREPSDVPRGTNGDSGLDHGHSSVPQNNNSNPNNNNNSNSNNASRTPSSTRSSSRPRETMGNISHLPVLRVDSLFGGAAKRNGNGNANSSNNSSNRNSSSTPVSMKRAHAESTTSGKRIKRESPTTTPLVSNNSSSNQGSAIGQGIGGTSASASASASKSSFTEQNRGDFALDMSSPDPTKPRSQKDLQKRLQKKKSKAGECKMDVDFGTPSQQMSGDNGNGHSTSSVNTNPPGGIGINSGSVNVGNTSGGISTQSSSVLGGASFTSQVFNSSGGSGAGTQGFFTAHGGGGGAAASGSVGPSFNGNFHGTAPMAQQQQQQQPSTYGNGMGATSMPMAASASTHAPPNASMLFSSAPQYNGSVHGTTPMATQQQPTPPFTHGNGMGAATMPMATTNAPTFHNSGSTAPQYNGVLGNNAQTPQQQQPTATTYGSGIGAPTNQQPTSLPTTAQPKPATPGDLQKMLEDKQSERLALQEKDKKLDALLARQGKEEQNLLRALNENKTSQKQTREEKLQNKAQQEAIDTDILALVYRLGTLNGPAGASQPLAPPNLSNRRNKPRRDAATVVDVQAKVDVASWNRWHGLILTDPNQLRSELRDSGLKPLADHIRKSDDNNVKKGILVEVCDIFKYGRVQNVEPVKRALEKEIQGSGTKLRACFVKDVGNGQKEDMDTATSYEEFLDFDVSFSTRDTLLYSRSERMEWFVEAVLPEIQRMG